MEINPQNINSKHIVCIEYQNWKDEISIRQIIPKRMYFGSTQFHPEEQWLLEAYDVNKEVDRTFAMKDILDWWIED